MLRTTLAVALILAGPAFAQSTPSPEGAQVYFVSLEDGATVQSPVTIRFGLSGMGVAPAGVDVANTGHHHLLVNRAPFGEDDEGFGVPADDQHLHFGGGQTEVTLDLPPGTHTLQLVLADLNHVPHDPPVVSEVIRVTVE
ncbi:MAG: DUF4399 domain-containing protein [Roseicyclus sp.]